MPAVGPPVFATVTVSVRKHPFESATIAVYVPEASPVAVALVPPVGDHEYVYDPVPPDALTVAVPSLIPQVAGVDDRERVITGGSFNVTDAMVAQLLLSVTIIS